MVRLLLFFAALALAAYGLTWLAENPGEVTLTWRGVEVNVSVMLALGIVLALAIALGILWTLIRFIFRAPSLISLATNARRREKGYLALVKGQWDLGKKRIDAPLNTETRVGGERTVRVQAGGKSALSTFSPVQFFRNRASMVEVDLDTGRTHQIRVHAAHVGHPVAGDEKYGDAEFNARMRNEGLNRMFLHSHRISFDWPNGGDFSASAPLPPDLAAVLDALGEATRARSGRRR